MIKGSNRASPKVSVCVVTYNHERYIEACLDSLLNQVTDFEFEVIVGDDCSTDSTGLIVDRLAERDSRVRVLRPSRNIGVTQNLLATHNAARGEYVAHLDGDDLALPGKLAAQVRLLDSNRHLSLCGHSMRVVDEVGHSTGAVYPASLRGAFGLSKIIRCGMPVLASSIMYRSDARSIRSLDYELLDWFLYTDILRRGKGGIIPEVLGEYRVNRSSLTAQLAFSGLHKRMLGLYERRFVEMRRLKPAFFAWAILSALAAMKNKAPITPEHWRFIRRTATPLAAWDILDGAIWTLQNQRGLAR